MAAGHMENAKNISFLALTKANSPDHLSKEEYLKCEYISCINSPDNLQTLLTYPKREHPYCNPIAFLITTIS